MRRRGRRQRRGRQKRKRRRGRGVIFPHSHCPDKFQLGREKGGNRRYPEDYRYYKAPNVNVSTSEPIFVGSQESTDTLPMGKKEGRRDYVAREVDILRRYMKGRDIDTANWSLRYPDPCSQQGSGDDCAIFTCKYMECLARRDTQGFPFSQDDMRSVRARFAVHLIKAYFNAQEHSERI
ncbi:hypothetical protein Taro_051838 [Colocasia esculenta]|uniref:Ubiquitin-like protease family profile domain-containing protein n=1 Tax=Colocasia esculenta TaxID=4460 RepID=A0A843XHW5_COLES|nr:hypothetical protein [Colocasia esculenta]